ncbi:hypothetical protein BJX61DRAFT_264821 [Aspergillus egyptiacus]|nr:hypothetical protein BJX61DRAFT_264821 [Aspergillus egyptiacus]
MKSFFLAAALLASSTYGHIQMSKPYPIRSPLNQDATGEKDYSYTNPLSTSGSDFPCKGYHKDPFHSVATYDPGSEYDLELQGSATHGGGSCQISLSYDEGETFKVIHSMLGGCPLTKSYKFKIPADAPSGEALLAWTWFNKIGNREMYMNCAQVTIGSGARQDGFTAVSQSSAFSSLPPIFIANVNGPGQCKTTEGEEVNFPKPGPSVEGSLSGKGYQCSGSAPFLPGSNSAKTSSDSSASSNSSSSSVESSTVVAHGPVVFSSATASSSDLATPTHGPALLDSHQDGNKDECKDENGNEHKNKDEDEDGSCVSGTLICAEDGFSFYLCDHGSPVYMGPVAPGTHCVHGEIRHLSE